jgi:hypothetical protein
MVAWADRQSGTCDNYWSSRIRQHHAFAVGADVPIADIISPDDQDIWFPSHAAPPLIRNFIIDFKNGNNCTPFPLLALCEKIFIWNDPA